MNVDVTFLPDNKTVSVRPGTTVLSAARMAKVHIRTRCGGNASCLMCKVAVDDPGLLSAMDHKEKLKLGDSSGSTRLACQAKITHPVTVSVPEDPLKAAVRAQLLKQQEEDW